MTTEDAQIHLRVPAPIKGAWVAASRRAGMKLTDWILEKMMNANFDGFTLNVPALLPFEAYVQTLGDDDARKLFKRVREYDAAQVDAIVAVKVARSYLEKRVCIADGIADHTLFHDINVLALEYFSMYPQLTHADLLQVVLV